MYFLNPSLMTYTERQLTAAILLVGFLLMYLSGSEGTLATCIAGVCFYGAFYHIHKLSNN